MEDNFAAKPHTLLIEDRRRVSVTGVTDVGSFDDESVSLATEHGALVLRGRELKIERIDLERGEVSASGVVEAAEYEAPPLKKRRARQRGL